MRSRKSIGFRLCRALSEASLRLRDAYGADARGVGDCPLSLLFVGEQRG